MTQAEIEAELASLRSHVDELRTRESKRADRAKAWRTILTIVRLLVVGIALLGAGLLVHAWMANQSLVPATQLLLLNVPLIFLGLTLQIGTESLDAKG